MILVFAESHQGTFKKPALEALTYGYKAAQLLGLPMNALVIGETNAAATLGQYGASKVLHIPFSGDFDSQVFAHWIGKTARDLGATLVILAHTTTGKSLTGRIAAMLDAGNVSGVNSLPEVSNGFRVRKNVFSGKAVAEYELHSPVKVLSIMGNTFAPEVVGSDTTVEQLPVEHAKAKVKVVRRETVSGMVALPEAEIVVSAGRGLKGPENWGIIEQLAETIGAATACSRPVADAHWRPHHEHVGQTGVAIRPNLYFAIGISGAIQHLAGVNGSKVIVVINKDADAPFFKAADYGVVGDAFEIVPRLTEAFQRFKAAQ